MTRLDANQVLESARAGDWVSRARITQALIVTGDLGPGGRPVRHAREPDDWVSGEIEAAVYATDGLAA